MAFTFLPNFPTHRGPNTGQVAEFLLLFAVRDRQGAVVKGIGALGIRVGAAFPAFYRQTWQLKLAIIE